MEKKKIFLCVFFIFVASGCASLSTEEEIFFDDYPEPEPIGVYHKVNSGETLWRIAKTYDVALEDIIKTNNIPNVAKLEKNQLVFIPSVYSVKEVAVGVDENAEEFIWPVKGQVISFYNDREGKLVNKGINIKTEEGALVKASRSGNVVFADYLAGWGLTVVLDHKDDFYSLYTNNAELLVKLGQSVYKHDAIAKVGKTSRTPYLHFEIRKNSYEENPLYYLP